MSEIYISLKKNDTAAYSIHEALRAVIIHNSTCLFIDGLQKALQEWTQYTSAFKITRSRSNLIFLGAERALEKDVGSMHAQGLNARIRAINSMLQTEELR